MIPAFVILLLLSCVYIGSVGGRTGHPGLKELRGWNYAHRGLHSPGVPENSMAAFRASLEHGYGIEFDLHLLKDGNLAVIHDSLLKRTTGREGRIEDLTTEDLPHYPLEGTAETIPTFRQLLDLYAGKAPLIVELKPVDGNHAQLAETACEMLKDYPGVYCMESFDPRCVYWLKKNRPQIIRGQLAENFFRSNSSLPGWLKCILTNSLSHFLTMPDFTAYKYSDRKNPGTWICRKLYGIQGVSWTLRSREEYDTALKEGWIPIFENFIP